MNTSIVERSHFENWSQNLAEAISSTTEKHFHTDGFALVAPEDATETDLVTVINSLSGQADIAEAQEGLLRYNIGRMINSLATVKQVTPDEVIDELDLPRHFRRSAKTVRNWAQVASVTPPDIITAGNNWTQIAESASQRPPEDPAAAQRFNERKKELLKEAALDPDEKNSKWVRDQIREAKDDLSDEPVRPPRESNVDMMIRLLKMMRFERVATADDLVGVGYKNREHLSDAISETENELINREAIEADPVDDM